MNKNQILKRIKQDRVVAVIRLDDLSQAQPLVEHLLAGGVRSLEFTLTNPEALAVVKQLRQTIPAFDSGEAVIGIGSIRNQEQAQQAVDSGAQLLVSPTLVEGLIEVGKQADVVTAPAGFTPTEIERAQVLGADVVKIFPATMLGSKYIKNILAPMPELQLMPTGGIDLSNIADYLNAGVVAVGVGSALVNPKLIAEQNWSEIQRIAQAYATAARVSS